MDLIKQNELYKLLERNEIIKGKEINLKNIDFKKISFARFENCSFSSNSIMLNNSEKQSNEIKKINITFDNCEFNDVFISSIKNIASLTFINIKRSKDIRILGCDIDSLIFQNTFNINFKIEISFCKFLELFYFSGNQFSESGSIEFIQNTFSKLTTINHNNLSNLNFTRQTFKDFFIFENVFLEGSKSFFIECEFSKAKFSKSKFSELTFNNCDFMSTYWLEECENFANTKVKFLACEFKGFTLFNKSKINYFDIDRCTFNKSSSFTDAEFNILKLFEVKFGGGAYFDEMKINNVLDKSYLKDKSKILEWKRTLRAIKQELQKTENKIDFNTYRNYELAAHYKELNVFKNFKDTSILWATKWSSNFGNWFWAFGFTIISGLFWYIILYRIENSSTFNFEKANDFFVGAFRFFLVTDFYNPLENGRTYLEHGWSWLTFILGKIFIAFGIYEMIQSFRKFKA